MTTEAAISAFAVVFAIFVVATVVLIVLVLRFTFQRAALARSRWLDETAGTDDDEGDEDEKGPLTALVFAGGGTRGAVQIGMLQVLAEHGFVPDRIYGASVGAVNGAGFASNPTKEGVEGMTRIWTGLSREDVYPQGRLHGPWMYFQQRDAVYSNSGLRKIIEDGVGFERLEDSPIPIEVVATSLVDGQERWFTYGPAVDAILASAALPAIFPPVEIAGERYMDGGVVNNVPIQRAIEGGAKRIVVLLCSPPVFEPATAKRPIESVLNALFIAVNARFPRDMSHLPVDVEVVLCAGGHPGEGGPSFGDFSTTAELIAEGRREAAEVVRRYGLGSPESEMTSAVTSGAPPDRATERDLPGFGAAPTTEGSGWWFRFRRLAAVGRGDARTGASRPSDSRPAPGVPAISGTAEPSSPARTNGSGDVVAPAPAPSDMPVSAPGSGGPTSHPEPGT